MTTRATVLRPTAGRPLCRLPRRRPWFRITVVAVAIAASSIFGWWWHVGVFRPAPDCCGSGSATPQLGLSDRSEAATISAYFFNSSSQALTITGADADLPGARVVGVALFDDADSALPPQRVGLFPRTVDGRSGVWLAIDFVPDDCDRRGVALSARDDAWGTLTVDLAVAGKHWYPTLKRRYSVPDPVVPAGPSAYGVIPPAEFSPADVRDKAPLDVACLLLAG